MAEASVAFGDLVDLVGDKTMSLAVYLHRRLGIRSIDEAEDLPRLLIDPIPFVVHSVLSLRLRVRLMRAGDVACSGLGMPVPAASAFCDNERWRSGLSPGQNVPWSGLREVIMMTGQSMTAVVVGAVAAAAGFVGLTMASVPTEHRDSDGYYIDDPYTLSAPSRAIVTDDIDILKGVYGPLADDAGSRETLAQVDRETWLEVIPKAADEAAPVDPDRSTIEPAAQGPAHRTVPGTVVELVVAVHGGHHGAGGAPREHESPEVGLRQVGLDHVDPVGPQGGPRPPRGLGDRPAADDPLLADRMHDLEDLAKMIGQERALMARALEAALAKLEEALPFPHFPDACDVLRLPLDARREVADLEIVLHRLRRFDEPDEGRLRD